MDHLHGGQSLYLAGPDLRRIPGRKDEPYFYGVLPPKLLAKTTQTLLKSLAKIVRRSE
jgi:hypothetical protein